MKNSSTSRNSFIHLYDPKKEGLGSYDIHYINAYRKDKESKSLLRIQDKKRDVA